MNKSKQSSLSRPPSSQRSRKSTPTAFRHSPSMPKFDIEKNYKKAINRSPLSGSKVNLFDKDFLLHRRDAQLWELTQEIKKLEENHKSVVSVLEHKMQNSSAAVSRESELQYENFTNEINSLKEERDSLYTSNIIKSKEIQRLESQIKSDREIYEKEIKNFNQKIEAANVKPYRGVSSLRSSPTHRLSIDLEEEYKKEKERAMTFYNALKRKEKECEAFHHTDSSRTQPKKIENLVIENNDLRKALADAQSDIKRMYVEIKYLNEQIYHQRKTIEGENTVKRQEIEDNLRDEIEDLKIKLKRVIEGKVIIQDDLERTNNKCFEMEIRAKELGQELVTITRELELRNVEYESMHKELEIVKRHNHSKLLKQLDSEKEKSLNLITTITNEINAQVDVLADKLENSEDKLDKLLEFESQLREYLEKSKDEANKSDIEHLESELSKANEIIFELKNKLETESTKRLTEAAFYENEGLKHNSAIKEMKTELKSKKYLEEEYKRLKEDIEELNKKLDSERSKYEKLEEEYKESKISHQKLESKFGLLKTSGEEKSAEISNLKIENSEIVAKLEIMEMKYIEACDALKELHSSTFELNKKEDESEQWQADVEDYKEKINSLSSDLKEALDKNEAYEESLEKNKTEIKNLQEDFENLKDAMKEILDKNEKYEKSLEKNKIEIKNLQETCKDNKNEILEKEKEIEAVSELNSKLKENEESMHEEQIKMKLAIEKLKNQLFTEKSNYEEVLKAKDNELCDLKILQKEQESKNEEAKNKVFYDELEENIEQMRILEETIKSLKEENSANLLKQERAKRAFDAELSTMQQQYDEKIRTLLQMNDETKSELDQVQSKFNEKAKELKLCGDSKKEVLDELASRQSHIKFLEYTLDCIQNTNENNTENWTKNVKELQYKLESEIAKNENLGKELEKANQLLIKHQSGIESQINDMGDKIREQNLLIQSQEKEIQRLHSIISQLEAQPINDENLYVVNTKIEDLESQNEDYIYQIEKLESENKELKENLAEFQEKTDMNACIEISEEFYREKLQKKKEKIIALREKLYEIEVKNNESIMKNSGLENEYVQKSKILKDMQVEYGEQNVRLNEEIQRAEQFESLYTALYADYEEQRKQIVFLQKEIEDMQNSAQSQEKRNSLLEENKEAKNEELIELKQRIIDLEAENKLISDREESINRYRELYGTDSLEGEKIWEEKCGSLQNELFILQVEYTNLQKIYDELKKSQNIEASSYDLEDLDFIVSENKRLEEELILLKKEWQEENEKKNEDLKQKNSEIENLKTEIKINKELLEKYQIENKDVLDNTEVMKKEFNAKVSEMSIELQEAQLKIEENKTAFNELQEYVYSLENEHASVKNDYFKEQEKIAALEKELEQTRQESESKKSPRKKKNA
ncbi:unnamed protein product [Blepharisma stoltei]|uniref:Uncharacterized protein n=1 Tax=Blepharisma stoltei TaxID=1481888 RepID=A0AAU9J8R3_9CILI|nr:unnamed protein product [Blepharisma stoltei]